MDMKYIADDDDDDDDDGISSDNGAVQCVCSS